MATLTVSPLEVETLAEAFAIARGDTTMAPSRAHVEALAAMAHRLGSALMQTERDVHILAAMFDEEPGGSCEMCGENDAVTEVDDSDPSVGYYSVVSVCRCCLGAKREAIQ